MRYERCREEGREGKGREWSRWENKGGNMKWDGRRKEGAMEDCGGLGSSIVHDGDLERRREGRKRKEDNMA